MSCELGAKPLSQKMLQVKLIKALAINFFLNFCTSVQNRVCVCVCVPQREAVIHSDKNFEQYLAKFEPIETLKA